MVRTDLTNQFHCLMVEKNLTNLFHCLVKEETNLIKLNLLFSLLPDNLRHGIFHFSWICTQIYCDFMAIPNDFSLISEDFGVGFLIKVNYQRLICSGKRYRLDTTRSESLTSCIAYIFKKIFWKKAYIYILVNLSWLSVNTGIHVASQEILYQWTNHKFIKWFSLWLSK